MIDTVKLFLPIILNGHEPPEWQSTEHLYRKLNPETNERIQYAKVDYTDPVSGIRARGPEGRVLWIEGSLPRLLYGNNARLITTPDEMNEGLRRLRHKVRELGELQTGNYFTRVDLVWQFRGRMEDFRVAHQYAKQKSIRKGTGHYDGQSLYWPGSKMRVRMYDKVLEQTGKPGDIVRVEVQLRGKPLKDELAGGADRVQELDFWDCYAAYRRILLGFCLPPLPRVPKIAKLLALGAKHGWNADGVPAFELWTLGKSPRQISRLRRELATLRPTVHHIDWAKMLPADQLPPIVEMEVIGTSRQDDIGCPAEADEGAVHHPQHKQAAAQQLIAGQRVHTEGEWIDQGEDVGCGATSKHGVRASLHAPQRGALAQPEHRALREPAPDTRASNPASIRTDDDASRLSGPKNDQTDICHPNSTTTQFSEPTT